MQLSKHFSKRSVAVLMILSALVASIGTYFASSAPTPYVGDLTDIYFDPPLNVYQLIVGEYNSTYFYVKNGTTGQIMYLFTVRGDAVNNASDILHTTYGTCYVKYLGGTASSVVLHGGHWIIDENQVVEYTVDADHGQTIEDYPDGTFMHYQGGVLTYSGNYVSGTLTVVGDISCQYIYATANSSSGGGGSGTGQNPYRFVVTPNGTNYDAIDYDGGLAFQSANASLAIQYALDHLTGSRVQIEWVVLRGYFSIDGIISIDDYTGLDLYGAKLNLIKSQDAIFRSASYSTPSVSDTCIFRGGILDGNKASYATGSGVKGYFANSLFEDMIIIEMSDYGMQWQGYSDTVRSIANIASNCWFGRSSTGTGNEAGGLFLDHNGYAVYDCHVSDCYFINNGAFGIGSDIAITDTKILNCHFAGLPSPSSETDARGIQISGYSSRTVIYGCTFENVEKEAIWFQTGASDWARFNSITDCKFWSCGRLADNTYAGIEFDGDTGDIYGNTVIGCTFQNSSTTNSYRLSYCIAFEGGGCVNNSASYNSFLENEFGIRPYVTSAVLNEGTDNIIRFNLGLVTDLAGSQASCINGTAIAHGLDGTPTSVTLSILGTNPYINSTAWYFAPTVLAINSTHFIVSFCINNAGTFTPVAADNAKTIYWFASYLP